MDDIYAGRVPLTDDQGNPLEWTPQTMEQALLSRAVVSQDDYRRLAEQRAFNAKRYLLESGQVPRERVFILAPQIDGKGADGDAQVVFRLK